MLNIITVHGTNDISTSDEGDRWWQIGSGFHKSVCDRFGDDTRFHPFHWDGKNSELSRRSAAEALLSRLITAEQIGSPYLVLGHSHGGSVLRYAIILAARTGVDLPNMQRWQTIGSPFFNIKPKSNYLTSHSIFGIAILAMLVTLLIVGVGALLPDSSRVTQALGLFSIVGNGVFDGIINNGGNDNILSMSYGWMTVLGAPPALMVFAVYFRNHLKSINRFRWSDRFYGHPLFHPDRFDAIWHENDEAVIALKSATTKKIRIIPRSVFTPFIRLYTALATPTFMVLTVLGLVAAFVAVNLITSLMALDQDQFEDQLANASLVDRIALMRSLEQGDGFLGILITAFWSWPILVIALVPLLLFLVDRTLKWTLGSFIKNFVDGVLTGEVRKAALGLDDPSQKIVSVSPHPAAALKAEYLPKTEAGNLVTYADTHSSELTTKIRGILNYEFASFGETVVLDEELVTWQELIHTTYFHEPSVVDYITRTWRTPNTTSAPTAETDVSGSRATGAPSKTRKNVPWLITAFGALMAIMLVIGVYQFNARSQAFTDDRITIETLAQQAAEPETVIENDNSDTEPQIELDEFGMSPVERTASDGPRYPPLKLTDIGLWVLKWVIYVLAGSVAILFIPSIIGLSLLLLSTIFRTSFGPLGRWLKSMTFPMTIISIWGWSLFQLYPLNQSNYLLAGIVFTSLVFLGLGERGSVAVVKSISSRLPGFFFIGGGLLSLALVGKPDLQILSLVGTGFALNLSYLWRLRRRPPADCMAFIAFGIILFVVQKHSSSTDFVAIAANGLGVFLAIWSLFLGWRSFDPNGRSGLVKTGWPLTPAAVVLIVALMIPTTDFYAGKWPEASVYLKQLAALLAQALPVLATLCLMVIGFSALDRLEETGEL